MNMKRVIYIDNDYNGKDKFVLKREYEGFGIYQKMCPTGFYEHNTWLITDCDVYLEVESYNNYCYEEILDLIDCYNDMGDFGGIKAFIHEDKTLNRNIYYMHPSGNAI